MSAQHAKQLNGMLLHQTWYMRQPISDMEGAIALEAGSPKLIIAGNHCCCRLTANQMLLAGLNQRARRLQRGATKSPLSGTLSCLNASSFRFWVQVMFNPAAAVEHNI